MINNEKGEANWKTKEKLNENNQRKEKGMI